MCTSEGNRRAYRIELQEEEDEKAEALHTHSWKEAKNRYSLKPQEKPASTRRPTFRTLREAWFAVHCPSQKPHLLLASTLGSAMSPEPHACHWLCPSGSTPSSKASRSAQYSQHKRPAWAPRSYIILTAGQWTFKNRCRSDHLVTCNWPHICEPQNLDLPTPTPSKDRGPRTPVFPDSASKAAQLKQGPALHRPPGGPAFEKKNKDGEHKPHCPSGSDLTGLNTPKKKFSKGYIPKELE